MNHDHHHGAGAGHIGRRSAILSAAAALSSAALVGPGVAVAKDRRDDDDDDNRPLPQPKPIPGTLPGTDFHVFAPGPTTVTLPFSGFPLMGLDVDRSVFTDFRGFAAVAYPVGTAVGSDGETYNLEGDMRIYSGTYVPLTGPRREGTFGFI